jgi:hypothetical protein
MQFDVAPPRDQKIEFPRTAEGHFRRVVFYVGAAIAALCALAVVGSIAVAVGSVVAKLLHLH